MKKNSILRHNKIRHTCEICHKKKYEVFMEKIGGYANYWRYKSFRWKCLTCVRKW